MMWFWMRDGDEGGPFAYKLYNRVESGTKKKSQVEQKRDACERSHCAREFVSVKLEGKDRTIVLK